TRSPLNRGSFAPLALSTDWPPRRAAPLGCIDDENSLIIPVRVHNPVSDSFATWPVAGKHDFRAVRRPFWLVTVDSGRLVSQLFPVGAIGIHHPDVSVPVL